MKDENSDFQREGIMKKLLEKYKISSTKIVGIDSERENKDLKHI